MRTTDYVEQLFVTEMVAFFDAVGWVKEAYAWSLSAAGEPLPDAVRKA